jgi:hypothetical protein
MQFKEQQEFKVKNKNVITTDTYVSTIQSKVPQLQISKACIIFNSNNMGRETCDTFI